jgi:hypothetical protein
MSNLDRFSIAIGHFPFNVKGLQCDRSGPKPRLEAEACSFGGDLFLGGRVLKKRMDFGHAAGAAGGVAAA